jgi:DDE family transposase
MAGRTDFITDANWADILLVWLVTVDDAYQRQEKQHGRWRQRGPVPRFTDSEVITVSLFIDTIFHGHEALGLSFLRQYHRDLFPHLLPNGQFNARRRALGAITEQIRQDITRTFSLIDPQDPFRLIDSAPLPVCTYGRAGHNHTLAGSEYFGVMPNRKAKLFGLRLYLLTTTRQVIDGWLLAPASRRDCKIMPALLENRRGLTIFGDNAYADPIEAERLRTHQAITLLATPAKNVHQPWPREFRQWANRFRRRIESAFGVLATVFGIEQPSARSLSGLIARVTTRLLAYTLSFITGPLLAQLQP